MKGAMRSCQRGCGRRAREAVRDTVSGVRLQVCSPCAAPLLARSGWESLGYLDDPEPRHRPYVPSSPTSKDAATSVKRGHTSQAHRRILEAIGAGGRLTDEEVAEVTGLGPNTARPRRVELAKRRLIQADGTKPTRSGRRAIAWALTADGRSEAGPLHREQEAS